MNSQLLDRNHRLKSGSVKLRNLKCKTQVGEEISADRLTPNTNLLKVDELKTPIERRMKFKKKSGSVAIPDFNDE